MVVVLELLEAGGIGSLVCLLFRQFDCSKSLTGPKHVRDIFES